MGDSQTGEAVVVCPVCEKTWPKDLDTCPDDGSWLHEETVVEFARRPSRLTIPRTRSSSFTREPTFPGGQGAADPMEATVLATAGAAAAAVAAEPARPSKDLAPGTKAGEYVIEAKVGEGAMGTVYRAVHPAIGKEVAIKVISPKLLDEPDVVTRFLAEARAVAAIRHPNIVDIFGYSRLPDGRTYLTMEWLEGENLATRLARSPLERDEALDIMRQIARALEAAHAKQIIHRDLKPENVFLLDVSEDRVVKLLDFGLAKLTDQDAGVGVTREGQILGTPIYMSPEQCRSKGVDHRTDIYALGCLGYQLLAGRPPYDQDNAAELISAHLVTEPPRARSFHKDVPEILDDLLVRMIAKDPAARPTLADVRRAIKAVSARDSSILPSQPGPARRSAPIAVDPTAAAAAAAALADGLGGPTLRQTPAPIEPPEPPAVDPPAAAQPPAPTPVYKQPALVIAVIVVLALALYGLISLL